MNTLLRPAIAAALLAIAMPGYSQDATQAPPTPEAKPCMVKSFTGSRFHQTRNTSYDLVVTELVATPDGEFKGRLRFMRGGRIYSDQPLVGSIKSDATLRIDSRFIASDAEHDVQIVGKVQGEKFTGKEGNYGHVTATVKCQ